MCRQEVVINADSELDRCDYVYTIAMGIAIAKVRVLAEPSVIKQRSKEERNQGSEKNPKTKEEERGRGGNQGKGSVISRLRKNQAQNQEPIRLGSDQSGDSGPWPCEKEFLSCRALPRPSTVQVRAGRISRIGDSTDGSRCG
jgi:hypothetical protein